MASREEEMSYREIFETDPRPMWICDAETERLVAVNAAALALYGYQREEFLRLKPKNVAQGERHLKKDGSAFRAQTAERPIAFQGRGARLVTVCETREPGEAERLLEEKTLQLEAAQKEMDGFSYSISHDLRAPLRHIDGFSKALADDYGESLPQQAREYLARIGRAAQKMASLIDDLQKLGRVTRQELLRQQVNLSVLAQVISLELKHKEPGRKVEFVISDGVSADADPRLARALLEVLLGNAWKFTSKKEESRIEFGRLGESLFVRDDGAGFDMAYAEKLYAVFQRLHRADEFEGSGIGLAIAQRIVLRHGGRIWAESEVGRGATFYFTLQGDE